MHEGLRPTYMLPPALSLVPDRDVKLGMLIPLSIDKPRLPDPECNLTDSPHYAWPSQSLIKSESEENWSYDDEKSSSASAGLWADVPMLTAICGSLGFERRGSEGISVQARRVETTWFVPSHANYQAALQDPSAKEYLLQEPKAPVFMVTGMKIAYDAKVTLGKGKARDLHGDLGVDLTSVGVPARVGPQGDVKRSRESHFHAEKAGPFVLAYQLRKIRAKSGGQLEIKGYNRRAFLHSDEDQGAKTAETAFEDMWDVELVDSGTPWEDE